jgi:hypothetical protein
LPKNSQIEEIKKDGLKILSDSLNTLWDIYSGKLIRPEQQREGK